MEQSEITDVRFFPFTIGRLRFRLYLTFLITYYMIMKAIRTIGERFVLLRSCIVVTCFSNRLAHLLSLLFPWRFHHQRMSETWQLGALNVNECTRFRVWNFSKSDFLQSETADNHPDSDCQTDYRSNTTKLRAFTNPPNNQAEVPNYVANMT